MKTSNYIGDIFSQFTINIFSKKKSEMASNDEIEEELAAIEAILIDGLKIERRLEDDRPISVTFQVMSSKRRHLVKHLRTSYDS